jgi:hypothetical protein
MRAIAMIGAVLALMTAEAGAIAQAGAAPPSTGFSTGAGGSQMGVPGQDMRRGRITDDPRKVILSLAALTEFILAIVIATKNKHGGSPASP